MDILTGLIVVWDVAVLAFVYWIYRVSVNEEEEVRKIQDRLDRYVKGR